MKNRATLGFSEGALREFAFLTDFGYAVVESSQSRVRFANGELYVDIVHALGSYGIGVQFGSRANPGYEVSLEEIYQATGHGPRPQCMASTPEAVRHCLHFVAGIVRSQSDTLRGAPPLQEINDFRQRLTDYYAGKSSKWPWRRWLP